jgi:hypothetical protein
VKPPGIFNCFSGAILETVRMRRPVTWWFAALALLFGLAFAFRDLDLEGRARGKQKVTELLKTLTAAEADFRSNDRDGNGINDFWTGDVAGLHSLGAPVGPGRSESIRLIPPEIARADAAHPGAVPHHGYFFVAMQTDENGIPYRQVTDPRPGVKPERNLSKFAFCAYPAEYGRTGRFTFIIDEGNTRF